MQKADSDMFYPVKEVRKRKRDPVSRNWLYELEWGTGEMSWAVWDDLNPTLQAEALARHPKWRDCYDQKHTSSRSPNPLDLLVLAIEQDSEFMQSKKPKMLDTKQKEEKRKPADSLSADTMSVVRSFLSHSDISRMQRVTKHWTVKGRHLQATWRDQYLRMWQGERIPSEPCDWPMAYRRRLFTEFNWSYGRYDRFEIKLPTPVSPSTELLATPEYLVVYNLFRIQVVEIVTRRPHTSVQVEQILEVKKIGQANCCTVNGDRLYMGHKKGFVSVLSIPELKVLAVFPVHKGPLASIAVNQNKVVTHCGDCDALYACEHKQELNKWECMHLQTPSDWKWRLKPDNLTIDWQTGRVVRMRSKGVLRTSQHDEIKTAATSSVRYTAQQSHRGLFTEDGGTFVRLDCKHGVTLCTVLEVGSVFAIHAHTRLQFSRPLANSFTIVRHRDLLLLGHCGYTEISILNLTSSVQTGRIVLPAPMQTMCANPTRLFCMHQQGIRNQLVR